MKAHNRVLGALLYLAIVSVTYGQSSTIWKPEPKKLSPASEALIVELLNDIAVGTPAEQARDLADLGDLLWEVDEARAKEFLTKGVILATARGTKYKDDYEQVNVLQGILIFNRLFDKDKALAESVLSELKRLLLKSARRKEAEINSSRMFVALDLLRRNEKLAFELALLSTKGDRPALDSNSTKFFGTLSKANNPFADKYFRALVKAVAKSRDAGLMTELLNRGTLSRRKEERSDFEFRLSDQLLKLVLESLLPFIRSEEEQLSKKVRDNCRLASGHGRRLLPLYRRLIPMKVSIVEQAIKTCESADIAPHLKPGFLNGKALRTSEDFENFAKTITDSRVREVWMYSAALKARDEKDYRKAIRIMDQNGSSMRNREDIGWISTRVQVATALILDLIQQKKYADIKSAYDETPGELRPYLLLDVLERSARSTVNSVSEFNELFSNIKNEFAKRDFPLPKRAGWWHPINPARYIQLVEIYSRLGKQELALQTFREFIALQNELSTKFAGMDQEGNKIAYVNFRIDGWFLDKNYSEIVEQVGKLESVTIRKEFRKCILFHVTRNGSRSSSGIMKIK